MMAPVTSRMDSIAASLGDRPLSAMSRSTFSSTTMASSTTMPVASTIANRVSVLIEKPNAYRPANDPMSEMGTAMLGITVAGTLRRKTKITATTRRTVNPSSICTSSTDARIASQSYGARDLRSRISMLAS